MKTLKEIISPLRGEMAYQMFGISEARRLEIEIATQQICQQYYQSDKDIRITDVLYEMQDNFNINPTDEGDLAYIIFTVSITLNFYFESHGLKYEPPTA